tara:strand:- start:9957 stop:10364 length:408 start_codon:yes stop_codon:yes gene_type:complete
MNTKMSKLTIEQEARILFYIENFQGKSSKHMDRGLMYEIFNLFNPKEGRGPHVCTCLDKDTYGKVNNMISSYTFSDEIRFTPRFHQLLPQLALFKEEEIEVEDNVGKMDMSMFLKPEPKAKSVPVKAVPRSRKKK